MPEHLPGHTARQKRPLNLICSERFSSADRARSLAMDFSKLAALWIVCLGLLGDCRADKLNQASNEPQQLDNGMQPVHFLTEITGIILFYYL